MNQSISASSLVWRAPTVWLALTGSIATPTEHCLSLDLLLVQ